MAKINQAMQDLLRYNAAILPQKRSSFNKSHSHTTTFDSAFLVPVMWDRVLPGDEKKIRYSGLARMSTPIVPVMDDAKLDVWAFYCPDRLWWSHAKEFYGENLDASFNRDGQYIMPSLTPDRYLVRAEQSRVGIDGIGSLNDYFGFPLLVDSDSADNYKNFDLPVTAGLHRCYQLIWNEWFRNSSVQPALPLSTGDQVTEEEWVTIKRIRKVCKYPDFFTSLLPEPQAGDDVMLPIGEYAPVVTRSEKVDPFMHDGSLNVQNLTNNGYGASNPSVLGTSVTGNLKKIDTVDFQNRLGYAYSVYNFNTQQPSGEFLKYLDEDQLRSLVSNGPHAVPSNLWADLTSATAATINNLRAAVTVQQLLEIDSLAGKRYQNILQAHFGVFTPDATLQRPELLGATRTSIGMRQVLQTSATTDQPTPQGNTAAFSLTNLSNEWICNKAFTEPGFIIVLAAVRPVQSYSQGIDPLLTKLNRYDHYFPVFDNLGNQPVPRSAIYFTNTGNERDPSTYADDVLGYQEAWTEYRIKQNRVSGLMRPDLGSANDPDAPDSVVGSLAFWNYSNKFDNAPQLDEYFVEEDENLMDRALAVQTEPQFILDSYFEYIDVKNMSVHSIPGLLRL